MDLVNVVYYCEVISHCPFLVFTMILRLISRYVGLELGVGVRARRSHATPCKRPQSAKAASISSFLLMISHLADLISLAAPPLLPSAAPLPPSTLVRRAVAVAFAHAHSSDRFALAAPDCSDPLSRSRSSSGSSSELDDDGPQVRGAWPRCG